MKKEITFTVMPSIPIEIIQQLLVDFESQYGVQVHLKPMTWDNYRSESVGLAIKHQGADVSMMGTPVTSDLIGMNALRSFSLDEIASLGGSASFLPSRWHSGMRPGSADVWAVPWLVDFRVLYFWRERLARAGLDETAAFLDFQSLEQSLRCLKESGNALPWAVHYVRYNVLQAIASFIWEAGGDFFTPDGKQVIFHQPEAIRGMCTYFRLLQYIPFPAPVEDAFDLFERHQAAVTIGGGAILSHVNSPELGCVPVPGGSYLGGTDLVIWAHTKEEQACLELVRYLSRAHIQTHYGYLPPRLNELTNPLVFDPSVGSVLSRAALTGRTFPCVPMIGLVEERLSTALTQLQQEILAKPNEILAQPNGNLDLEPLIRARIEPLANRINLSLS